MCVGGGMAVIALIAADTPYNTLGNTSAPRAQGCILSIPFPPVRQESSRKATGQSTQ